MLIWEGTLHVRHFLMFSKLQANPPETRTGKENFSTLPCPRKDIHTVLLFILFLFVYFSFFFFICI